MKIVLVFALLVFSISSHAGSVGQSMRRCMLLPVSDSVGGVIGFKVFEEIEYYLRGSTWCYYRSNSDIIDILANYRQNLHEHLQNKEVLRVLAEKTRAGSMLRITLKSDVEGMEVQLDVVGDNGADIYFREKTRLQTDDINQIAQTIRNWLNQYEKRIPYDARVVGVLGDQFTVDMGREYGLLENRTAKVIRPVSKKQHPLFQEIVEWETEPIADAVFFHVVELQSQGRVMAYEGSKRLQINDWVVLAKDDGKEDERVHSPRSTEGSEYRFGRVGSIELSINVGTGSLGQIESNSNVRKIDGHLIGGGFNGELWITRNLWTGLDVKRRFGVFKQDEGDFDLERNSVSSGSLKAKFGYKYLPLGFFYGPQVDAYFGYGRYTYNFDTSPADGISDVRFGGLLFGTRGSIPFAEKLRAFLSLDFLLKPSFSEGVILQGRADSASNFNLGLGIIYDHSPIMSYSISYDYAQSKAKFIDPVRDVKYKDSGLKVGAIFSF